METVAVELPGGLPCEDAPPIMEVELRPLTGWEEWLTGHAGVPTALAVTALLDACIVGADRADPRPRLARRLLAGDRDYLILQLRRLTLGDRVQAVLECPRCGSKMDVDFLAGDVPVERRPQSAPVYTIDVGPGRGVAFRLPDGADQEFVAQMDTPEAVETLLARCVSAGAPLSPEEREAVIAAMEERAGRRTRSRSHLSRVRKRLRGSVRHNLVFDWELTGRRRYLLREVHSLRDSLSLERGRRNHEHGTVAAAGVPRTAERRNEAIVYVGTPWNR